MLKKKNIVYIFTLLFVFILNIASATTISEEQFKAWKRNLRHS